MPWLGHLMTKLRTVRPNRQDEYIFPAFVREHINRRQESKAQSQDTSLPSSQHDFLDRFLAAKQINPKTVNDSYVWCYAITNVVAGSDTIAIPLRSILYYVLSSKDIYKKLMLELVKSNFILPVSWKSAQQLPYLDAVVKEALRIHPPVGLGLERVVPIEGFHLPDGTFFEPGTLVSMNAWVLHRSEAIFGDDTNIFEPGRWLQRPNETEDDFRQRLHKMQQSEFTFGFGPRTCIGKNLSLLEIYKVVPTLFLSFNMKLFKADWNTWNSWFVRQEGLEIQLDTRLNQ
jgi:cytochrome P450